LLRRALRLVHSPTREWAAIAAEASSAAHALFRYVLPLSAVPAVAWTLGLAVFGADLGFRGEVARPSPEQILGAGIATFTGSVLSVFALAAAFFLVAPLYDAPREWGRAFKVAAYGTTPVWLAGVLLVMPLLAIVELVALMHCCYLYYCGLQAIAGVKRSGAAECVAIALFLMTFASILVGGLIGLLAS